MRYSPSILLATAAIAAALPAAAATVAVSIENFSFVPQDIVIQAGDTVTWTYNDTGARHDVASNSPGETFVSPDMRTPGETYSHTYNTVGTHPYECVYHAPDMIGSVTVNGAAMGACCTPAGCTQTAPTACGGTYQGDGIPCTPDPCAAPVPVTLKAVKSGQDVVFVWTGNPTQLCKAPLTAPPSTLSCIPIQISDPGVVETPPGFVYQVQ